MGWDWKERGREGEDTASLGKKGGLPAILQVGLDRPALREHHHHDTQRSRCITFRPCETSRIPRRFDVLLVKN